MNLSLVPWVEPRTWTLCGLLPRISSLLSLPHSWSHAALFVCLFLHALSHVHACHLSSSPALLILVPLIFSASSCCCFLSSPSNMVSSFFSCLFSLLPACLLSLFFLGRPNSTTANDRTLESSSSPGGTRSRNDRHGTFFSRLLLLLFLLRLLLLSHLPLSASACLLSLLQADRQGTAFCAHLPSSLPAALPFCLPFTSLYCPCLPPAHISPLSTTTSLLFAFCLSLVCVAFLSSPLPCLFLPFVALFCFSTARQAEELCASACLPIPPASPAVPPVPFFPLPHLLFLPPFAFFTCLFLCHANTTSLHTCRQTCSPVPRASLPPSPS